MHQSWKWWMKISRNALSAHPVWACRHAVSVSPLLHKKSFINNSTLLHLQGPSLNPTADTGHKWMNAAALPRASWPPELSPLFAPHAAYCMLKPTAIQRPLVVRAAAFPKPWDSWQAKGLWVLFFKLRQHCNKRTRGVLYAHTVYLHDARPPRFTQPDEV